MGKDKYRKVRRALKNIEEYVHHVESVSTNRKERRRLLYEDTRIQELVDNLKSSKRAIK